MLWLWLLNMNLSIKGRWMMMMVMMVTVILRFRLSLVVLGHMRYWHESICQGWDVGRHMLLSTYILRNRAQHGHGHMYHRSCMMVSVLRFWPVFRFLLPRSVLLCLSLHRHKSRHFVIVVFFMMRARRFFLGMIDRPRIICELCRSQWMT